MIERTAILEFLCTKRGLVVALITAVAVFGAGFGYVQSPLGDAESPKETPDEKGFETTVSTITPSDTTVPSTHVTETADSTDRHPEDETPNPAGPPDGTTEGPDRTKESGTTTASSGVDGDSADDPSSVGAQIEINVTIGSLADYPASSRTLNAVVNAPTTASTAGGA